MSAELQPSSAIDREGPGVIPGADSTYRIVDPIPRGRATLRRYYRSEFRFYGGAPRCPVCMHSGQRVRFNGRRLRHREHGEFHCIACRVQWNDSNEALCYVCERPFRCERSQSWFDRRELKLHATCYHINSIAHPMCPECEGKIGDSAFKHRRRTLRRMAGLR